MAYCNDDGRAGGESGRDVDKHADVGWVGAKVGDLLEALCHSCGCQSGKPEDGQKHVEIILCAVTLKDVLPLQIRTVPSQGGLSSLFYSPRRPGSHRQAPRQSATQINQTSRT